MLRISLATAVLDRVLRGGQILRRGVLMLTVAFEWGGSLLTRYPVREILIGWHVERGYVRPYVLAGCLLSP